MSALSSLLVRDQIVSVRKIEEAIQRQVISGGDVEEVLLDMGVVPENVMTAYCAAVLGAEPVSRDEVMKASKAVIDVLPKEAAEKFSVTPVAIDGNTLEVAAGALLDAAATEQLAFAVKQAVRVRITTRVRLAAALRKHYGVESTPRMRRLADKLRLRDPGDLPSIATPESEEALGAEPAQPAPPPEAKTPTKAKARAATQPASPAAKSAPKRPPPTKGARTQSGTLVRKLRGPLTAKAAVEALRQTSERDEILEVLFVFARQFFDYTALFVVHDDSAEGRDAHGSGADQAAVVQIAVPLDVAGTFATLRQTLTPTVVDLTASDMDALVAKDLQRAQSQPAVLVPFTIRGRAVLIVYGDRGGETFTTADVPELVAFPPRVAEAFERIILKRKYEGYGASPSEDRGSLKSAAGRLASTPTRDSAAPARSDYESAPPSQKKEQAKWKTGRARAFGPLGVPRSAPPPPSTGRGARGHAPPSSAPDDPEVTVEYGSDDDDGGDYSDDPPPARASATDLGSGSYRVHGASTDVLGGESTGAATGRGRRKPSGRRHDPRRDQDGSSVKHDVVRIPARTGNTQMPPALDKAPRPGRRKRQRSRGATQKDQNVIVDMGENVEELIDSLITRGPEDEEADVTKLLQTGEVALPALAQRFPGPLWFDRDEPHRRLPRGRDISAIARAMVAFRELAIPYVTTLLSGTDPDRRFYATLLSSEFTAPDLLRPLANLVFTDDSGTRILVLDVLKHYVQYAKPMEEVLKGIRVEAKVAREHPVRRQIAARALGELKDQKALAILIDLLGTKDSELIATAHRSLVLLTRQDFGESVRRWSNWADKHSEDHRIEWLIDGLLHADDEIRAVAGDELKQLTQQFFGYHPASPKRDREIAQRKYKGWWESEGRARFA